MYDIRSLTKPHYAISRALIIGIDQYKSAPPLAYAVSDAAAIREVLAEDFDFSLDNVTYLVDAEATRDRICKEFLRFAKSDVGVDDRVLVFYAGHGHTESGIRGEFGFLVPVDGDPEDLSTLIGWKYFTDHSDLISAKHILFIMDACYSGLALTRSVRSGSTRFLKDMLHRHARQVLTAGKADEVVADAGGPLPNHSVFTGHLIEGLGGKAATGEDIITANGLMAYVYGKVAVDKNSNQTPHYGSFDGDGDFVMKAPALADLGQSSAKDLDTLIEIPYPEDSAQTVPYVDKVSRVKELLSSESSSIELHDFLLDEVRRFLSATSGDSFALDDSFSNGEFADRIAKYEGVTLDIALLLSCVAHWGNAKQAVLLEKALARSGDRLSQQGGVSTWLALRWYPLLLELYCAGIAAVNGQRFDMLARVFGAPMQNPDDSAREEPFVETATRTFRDLSHEAFKTLPGHERHHVPLSEYLYKTLQPKLDDLFFLGQDYERDFDTFEVLFSLAVRDSRRDSGHVWGPVGRFGWKHHSRPNAPFERVYAEARSQGDDWPPLKAGLFGGSYRRFDEAAKGCRTSLNAVPML